MQRDRKALRILVYGINFSPELTGIGKYTGEMVQGLLARGHEVRVITAPPYYPNWKVWASYSSTGWRKEKFGDATIFRCPLWVPASPSGIKRLLHLASFALASLPALLSQVKWRPQIIWVVEPPLFCAPAALVVGKLFGAKTWLHIQDFEVDAAFALGLLPRGKMQRVAELMEHWLMQRFDIVSTISKRMFAGLVAKGLRQSSCRMLPNWVEVHRFPVTLTDEARNYLQILRIPSESVVALYSGNMGAKQGLEILAEAAEICENEESSRPIYFVFCGAGAGRTKLFNSCLRMSNVRFLDLQPVTMLPHLLALADIHLVPQRADAADLVLPSKLTGILASGRPAVVTADNQTELAEVMNNRGIIVPPGNGRKFAEAIMELAENSEKRKKMGRSRSALC